MPRNLVVLFIFFAVIVAGMFLLASIDVEQEPTLIEKSVIGGELE